MATRHKPLLRDYLMRLTEELLREGAIRRGANQSIPQVFRNSTLRVLREMYADLSEILEEIGVTLVNSAAAAGADNLAARLRALLLGPSGRK